MHKGSSRRITAPSATLQKLSADGSCDHQTKGIKIAVRPAPKRIVAVLIHESTHALVVVELGDRHAGAFDYASGELVVEPTPIVDSDGSRRTGARAA